MTTPAAVPTSITRADIERALAESSFVDFLGWVQIQEPPSPLHPRPSLIPFQKWPHLLEIAQLFTTQRLLLGPKSRQVGWTWLVSAYVAWVAQYQPGAVIFLFSKGEYEAGVFLGKVRTVWEHLPQHLQVRPGKPDNTLEMTFSNGSRIRAFASTKDAGRSETATLSVHDENEFHEYAEENFLSVQPTVDAGGQAIILSTSNKRKMLSLMKGLLRGSPANGWYIYFTPWRARPGRDDAWYEVTKASAPTSEGLSPELYMEQEYPGSLEEYMAPSRALAFFDQDVLKDMLANDCREPLQTIQGGLVRVWRPPVVAGKYVLGADTAWGVKGSFNAGVMLDWVTGEQVAEIYGRPHPDEMALACFNLHKAYNHAYTGIERAGMGQTRDGEGVVVAEKFALLLKECECKNRMFWVDGDSDKPERPGWQTDPKTRPVMLGELEEAVRLRGVVVRCRDGVGEMMSFIRNEAGRPEAAEGAQDDHVMAAAIAWQMRKHARFGTGTNKPVFTPRRF